VSWHVLAIAAAIGLFLFDFQNLLSRWRGRVLEPAVAKSWDWTIVVPLYGHPRYFAERAQLARYQGNVLVAMDVGNREMQDFADVLRAEGWHVFTTVLEEPSPPSLIKEALPQVRTSYVLRLDADTRVGDDLPHLMAALAEDGADLCSVKVEVHQPRTVAARFQALEYRMAMLARHFRPWLTSGACLIGKRSAIEEILSAHSMWFPGEDIEMGRVALALRMRVRHANIVVTTDAPERWYGLWKQRRLWWAGNFRHTVVNFDRNVFHLPGWTLYYIVLVWIGLYFKWWSLFDRELLLYIPYLWAVYALVTLVSNWQVRHWLMLAFPVYAFAQSVLMPIVGSIWYFQLVARRGKLGRYRFPYRRSRITERLWTFAAPGKVVVVQCSGGMMAVRRPVAERYIGAASGFEA
jgi:cellulose synthase/poly-beta-1,6-N-acetylglucosamine synthase-like glycosyltransferase